MNGSIQRHVLRTIAYFAENNNTDESKHPKQSAKGHQKKTFPTLLITTAPFTVNPVVINHSGSV